MTQNIIHDCVHCAARKEMLDIKIDEEDIDDYEDINAGVMAVNNMLDQFYKYEEKMTHEKAAIMINLMHEKESVYRKRERKWWSRMLGKYNITDKSKIDINRNSFYHCIYDNEEVVDFIAKDNENRLNIVK
jgi:hypothetical protein